METKHRLFVIETLHPEAHKDMLTCAALGLTSEAGEFAQLVRKHRHEGRSLDLHSALGELGDILYYLQVAGMALGVSLEDMVDANKQKLKARFPEKLAGRALV